MTTTESAANDHSADPILGDWELLNLQYRFTESGHVLLYGDPVALELALGPAGSDNCRQRIFVPLDEPFPDSRIEDVTVIISNQSLPMVIPDATIAVHDGQQGFWLRVTNSLRVNAQRDEIQASVSGNMKARSCDLVPGRSGVSWIAFGSVDEDESKL